MLGLGVLGFEVSTAKAAVLQASAAPSAPGLPAVVGTFFVVGQYSLSRAVSLKLQW
jgi:hypothetical protein